MKTQYERNLELALIIVIVLYLLLLGQIACGGSSCVSLWVSCPDLSRDIRICVNCKLVNTTTVDTILYFRFKDCETGQTFQTSVDSECTIKER